MSAGSGGGKVKVVVPVFLARPKIVLKFKLIGTVLGCFFPNSHTFDRIFVNAEIIR